MTARWGGSCGSAELAAPALQHAADAPGSTLHFWIVGNENLNEKQKIMLWPLGKKKDSGSCSGYPTVNNRYSTTTVWREELLPISTGNELFPVKS